MLKCGGFLVATRMGRQHIAAQMNVQRLNSLLAAKAKMSANWVKDCDLFHIQSLEVEPISGKWSDSIIEETHKLKAGA